MLSEWRSLYIPSQKEVSEDRELLITFYLSLKINATSLERSLGELCRHLSAHDGKGAEDGAVASALLEVALDGPQSEDALFQRLEQSSADSHPGCHSLGGPVPISTCNALGDGSGTNTMEKRTSVNDSHLLARSKQCKQRGIRLLTNYIGERTVMCVSCRL